MGVEKSRRIEIDDFRKKSPKENFGSVFDSQTKEWRKFHNKELQQTLFERPNIMREFSKRKLRWAGYT